MPSVQASRPLVLRPFLHEFVQDVLVAEGMLYLADSKKYRGSSVMDDEQIELGNWTKEKLDHMLAKATSIVEIGPRIAFISSQFMGTPYKESTLIGDARTPEVFVINLEAIDCFTYLDYVESMRLSESFSRFKTNLKKIRYRLGRVAYVHRNHFFTDWKEWNPSVTDVTGEIGRRRVRVVPKRLNEKTDTTYFVAGIPFTERDVTYIPTAIIDEAVIDSLRTGDYVGIYTEAAGLDVSHVGIIIKGEDSAHLRHASSAPSHRKVIDEEFKTYISGKPGMIVLRPTCYTVP